MASDIYNEASKKEMEDELVIVGKRLLLPNLFADELVFYLEKAERLLITVWQQPPTSTAEALLPLMKALVTDEILKHADENVQVLVASCFNELSRITVPDQPYNDDHMKEAFQLFIVALKGLSGEGANYNRALRILATVARVKSCLLLLDLECEGLIIEMFQLFLNSIRFRNPIKAVKYMEKIMTLVIQESGEISVDLLRPLLACVQLENKNTSPVAWELGVQVFHNCSRKLRKFLRKAVESLNLDVDDFAEIVTSTYLGTSSKEKMVRIQNGAVPRSNGPSKSKHGDTTQNKNALLQPNRDARMTNSTKSRPSKSTLVKRKKSENSSIVGSYGEELVGSRIKVWWPLDKEFYPGSITSFDSSTKKHKIMYDDGEEEILNLRKERWQHVDDPQPHEEQEVRAQSAATLPVKMKKMKAKRKADSLAEQASPSSSKRSRSKVGKDNKSGERLKLKGIKIEDDTDAERKETGIPSKDGGKRSGK